MRLSDMPQFPQFKPVELEDRECIRKKIQKYKPDTSELNFTNLFIWRYYYGFQWSVYKDWLLVLTTSEKAGTHFFPPVGPPSRKAVTEAVLRWLRDEKDVAEPVIIRADRRLAAELEGAGHLIVTPTPDHFDYVYRSDVLADLPGRKLHGKRNHINKFQRLYDFDYQALDGDLIIRSLNLFKHWHNWKECREDADAQAECVSIHETLLNFHELGLTGGAICSCGRVIAFTVGERLNETTAVTHIEKADPGIPQLYSVINQQFNAHAWKGKVTFTNREQDLGKPGLRQAKQSYYPDHRVEKFEIKLALD